MKKGRLIFTLGILIVFITLIGFTMQKNASAQVPIDPSILGFFTPSPFFSPFSSVPTAFSPFLWNLPIARTASVVTGTTGGSAAAVAGIWSGTWLSLVRFDGGLLNMVLTVDPVTGQIIGTVSLILNRLIPIPVDVTGTFLATTSILELTGAYLDIVSGTLYTLTMTGNLIAPGVMDGTYSIVSIKSTDFGSFNALLL
ncbi:MAG: hypothetical protein ACMUJM_04390 [bacterium]